MPRPGKPRERLGPNGFVLRSRGQEFLEEESRLDHILDAAVVIDVRPLAGILAKTDIAQSLV
jgi:hypothetical protein